MLLGLKKQPTDELETLRQQRGKVVADLAVVERRRNEQGNRWRKLLGSALTDPEGKAMMEVSSELYRTVLR